MKIKRRVVKGFTMTQKQWEQISKQNEKLNEGFLKAGLRMLEDIRGYRRASKREIQEKLERMQKALDLAESGSQE